MSGRLIEVSSLVRRKVRDADGRVVGRLEELHAEVAPDDPSEYEVRELRVGRYTVPWEMMDLSDPEHPKLRVAISKLRS